MLYLLDANVIMDANRDYYPYMSVPEFWEWLLYMGERGVVKIPIEVYEEIKVDKRSGDANEDPFCEWFRHADTKQKLVLNEEVNVSLVAMVIDKGYASDLNDDEVEEVGRDPFLIAYALFLNKDRCIVTTEVSKPNKKRANRRMPDVCSDFGIKCINPFKFIKDLNFSTNWKATVQLLGTN